MKKSFLSMLAVGTALAGSVAFAPPASALGDCMSQRDDYTLQATCNSNAPGTQFAIVFECPADGGGYRVSAWKDQGQWVTAHCNNISGVVFYRFR